MITVLVGLSAALLFGFADFIGGIASKRISAIRVTGIVAVAGLIALLAALPFLGAEWSWEAVLYGGLSGVAGAGAIVLLYACLAIGPMSILSPLTALVAAFVPLTVGLMRGERLSTIGYVAIAIALVAVVLVGLVKEETAVRPTLRALLMATASGALIGAFLILIDLTPDDSGLIPLIANRAVNATIIFSIIGVLAALAWRRARAPVLVRAAAIQGVAVHGATIRDAPGTAAAVRASAQDAARPRPVGMLSPGWRAGFWVAVACGLLDSVANALVLLGLRLGELSVMAVLSAMYPAGTIILAALVLRERITLVQGLGLVLALAAAGMLALA